MDKELTEFVGRAFKIEKKKWIGYIENILKNKDDYISKEQIFSHLENLLKKGEFWKGNIELPDGSKQNIIVFKNSYKKDKQPDLRIYKAKQKEQQEEKQEEIEIIPDSDLPF